MAHHPNDGNHAGTNLPTPFAPSLVLSLRSTIPPTTRFSFFLFFPFSLRPPPPLSLSLSTSLSTYLTRSTVLVARFSADTLPWRYLFGAAALPLSLIERSDPRSLPLTLPPFRRSPYLARFFGSCSIVPLLRTFAICIVHLFVQSPPPFASISWLTHFSTPFSTPRAVQNDDECLRFGGPGTEDSRIALLNQTNE